MEFSLITSPSESNQTDCLILGIFENQKHSPESSGFNLQTQGFIDTIIQRDNFDGTLGNTLKLKARKISNKKRRKIHQDT